MSRVHLELRLPAEVSGPSVDDQPEVQEMGAMRKKRDEAGYLETQADRLEQFIDFSDPRPAVFPKLKPSTARVTLRMPSWLLNN